MTQYLRTLRLRALFYLESPYRQNRYATLTGVQGVFQTFKMSWYELAEGMVHRRRCTYIFPLSWQADDPVPEDNRIYQSSVHIVTIQFSMWCKYAYTSLQKITSWIRRCAYGVTQQGKDKDAQQKYTCVLEKSSNWFSERMGDYSHKDKVLRGFECVWHKWRAGKSSNIGGKEMEGTKGLMCICTTEFWSSESGNKKTSVEKFVFGSFRSKAQHFHKSIEHS
jgi:hypothetical protein